MKRNEVINSVLRTLAKGNKKKKNLCKCLNLIGGDNVLVPL